MAEFALHNRLKYFLEEHSYFDNPAFLAVLVGWLTPSNVLPLFDITEHKAIDCLVFSRLGPNSETQMFKYKNDLIRQTI